MSRPYRERLVARIVEDKLESMSVAQLAEEAGVSPNVIYRMARRESVAIQSTVSVLKACGWELCLRERRMRP